MAAEGEALVPDAGQGEVGVSAGGGVVLVEEEVAIGNDICLFLLQKGRMEVCCLEMRVF